jgi:hypothetical protein
MASNEFCDTLYVSIQNIEVPTENLHESFSDLMTRQSTKGGRLFFLIRDKEALFQHFPYFENIVV